MPKLQIQKEPRQQQEQNKELDKETSITKCKCKQIRTKCVKKSHRFQHGKPSRTWAYVRKARKSPSLPSPN